MSLSAVDSVAGASGNWGDDIKAGLVVFLIALPLSLGISIASGAPSTAGLISAALGGIIGAYLGGSYVTINGPAAGLIVVVLAAIQSLSFGDPLMGFKRFLAVVVIVGILQFLSGILKFGRFVAFFPTSVVQGMLASIGLIIMIKQIHTVVGEKAQGSVINSILQIPVSLAHINPHAFLIGGMGFAILLLYPSIKAGFTRYIPAPLIVVSIGVAIAFQFKDVSLVKIPLNVREFFIFPAFDMITSKESIMAVVSIYFVASLESILSASAVDKLDPLQRESDFDREFWSKGIVNLCCGLVGGLPIIAEIVRSSANITQGGKTQLSNFSHGIFILVFAALFPAILNLIPLPALAAILVMVGYRLAHPKQFSEMKQMGLSSFVAFLTTIALTIAYDLLVGIFAGVVMKAVVSRFQGARITLSPQYRLRNQGDEAILEFEHSLSFFSALKQRQILHGLSAYRSVEINLKDLKFIDPTSIGIFTKEAHRLIKEGKKVTIHVPPRYEHIYQKLKMH
jgi:MFS superfamily sulfate permease-like transporter